MLFHVFIRTWETMAVDNVQKNELKTSCIYIFNPTE